MGYRIPAVHTSRRKNVVIRMSWWHLDVGHESNDKIVTPDDIKKIKASLKDKDLVLCIFGATVAGTNTWSQLFDGDVPPLDETPFFEPFTAKVLRKRRVIILLPHIGVLNNVGELDWIIQSFADAIPITLMLGTFAKSVKADSSVPSNSATAAVFDLYRKSEVCETFSRRLEWPKLRSFWNGKIAPRVQKHLDEGVEWSKVYAAVAKELKISVVLTLDVSDPDATPILIPKQGENERDIYLHISVPPLHGDGRYELEEMWIPQQFRAKDDYYATLQLHPETLHLQLVKTDGTLATSTNGNPFSIPRPHWMTSLSYNGRAIKAHAERLGIWRPLSAAESRQKTYFQRCIEEVGEAKNTWTKMRCVQTLDEDEIRRGVPLGEPYLHPISDSFKFRFWDGDVDFLHLKKNPKKAPTAWEVAQFKNNRPAGVHWVAPILDKMNASNWRFLMYGCSETNTPFYIGRSQSWSPKGRWKQPWPILNGASETYLYKQLYPDEH